MMVKTTKATVPIKARNVNFNIAEKYYEELEALALAVAALVS